MNPTTLNDGIAALRATVLADLNAGRDRLLAIRADLDPERTEYVLQMPNSLLVLHIEPDGSRLGGFADATRYTDPVEAQSIARRYRDDTGACAEAVEVRAAIDRKLARLEHLIAALEAQQKNVQ